MRGDAGTGILEAGDAVVDGCGRAWRRGRRERLPATWGLGATPERRQLRYLARRCGMARAAGSKAEEARCRWGTGALTRRPAGGAQRRRELR